MLVSSLMVVIYLLKLVMSVCRNTVQKHHMHSPSDCSFYGASAKVKFAKVCYGVPSYQRMAYILNIYASKNTTKHNQKAIHKVKIYIYCRSFYKPIENVNC